jgi:hypothetical protein
MNKKIELVIHEKPDLPICKMNCDGGLAKHLEKYELTKFFNQHQISLLIGRPKSGKTSLLYSFFKGKKEDEKILRGVYSRVYLFQPENSANSMKDNIFNLIPKEQRFTELTFENLEHVYNLVAADGLQGFKSCVILDDMTAYLKQKSTYNLFREMLMNKRHLKLSMFFLVQTWRSVPKDMRRLWDNVFLFRVSKNEMEDIFEELVETHKDNIDSISKFVFDKPYQFLFINPDSRRMFKCFDEIILHDGNDNMW